MKIIKFIEKGYTPTPYTPETSSITFKCIAPYIGKNIGTKGSCMSF